MLRRYSRGAPPYLGHRRFVHELSSSDAAPQRRCVTKQHPRLDRSPDSVGVARAGTDGKGSHDLCVRGASELDHTSPFGAREDTAVPLRRGPRSGYVAILKENGVCAGAAHPHVGGSQRRSQLSQARLCEIDRCAVLKQGWIHAAAHMSNGGSPGHEIGVRSPEAAASHLRHLDVVGLEALVHRPDTRHRCNIQPCDLAG